MDWFATPCAFFCTNRSFLNVTWYYWRNFSLPEDTTFVSTEEERKEYVLQETGLIWRGTHNRLRPCAWHYAQFDKDIVQCVLMMLTEVCRMSPPNRADPAKVARAISAGVSISQNSVFKGWDLVLERMQGKQKLLMSLVERYTNFI